MRRITAGLLAAAVGAQMASANAQDLPATDNELYAGYCIGATEALENDPFVRDLDKNLENGGQQRVAEELRRRRQRFAGYLFSRGVTTSPERRSAMLGVLTARSQGSQEQKSCLNQMSECLSKYPIPSLDLTKPQSTETKRKYLDDLKRRDDELTACDARGASSPVCQRTRRCGEPDNLPF